LSLFGLLLLVCCLGALLLSAAASIKAPVNLLILGIDRRPDQGDVSHTDTMLLVRVDSRRPSIKLLSIPRDLWVTIPGQGEGRINTAHFIGEVIKAGTGPKLAAETVNLNFDLKVHRTLRLDFDDFRTVIDAAGGIDVDVPYTIVDTAYPTEDYGTTTIRIPAGRQHMDGETALRYARTRHGSSDFERAARQQQILVALGKKLSSPLNWWRLPGVYGALRRAVDTDLSFVDLVQLSLTLARVGAGGIEHTVIDQNMTTPFVTAQGSAVLLPRWDLINPVVEGWR
jgi:LCP family protein required for cell wall assembly